MFKQLLAIALGRTRRPNNTLSVVHLDDRIVPSAAWPFNGTPAQYQLLETYGQYQEMTVQQIVNVQGVMTVKDVDANIHSHEGIDITAPVNTKVLAVADGEVVDFKGAGYGM